MELMYITPTEYNTITGRDSTEATTIRITLSSKLLDSRIGNYPTFEDIGYKINSSWQVEEDGVNTTLTKSKKDAIQMWVAQMVSYLYDNNDTPPTSESGVSLGRFSVNGSSNISDIPDEVKYADSILISSGIINRKVGRYRRNELYDF